MAARMLKNITEDYLSCRICLGRYTDPCRLPCEHVFCRTCLTGHIAEKLAIHPSSRLCYFTCPLCRTETYAPSENIHPHEWIESLPRDNLVEDLLEAVSGHENEAHSRKSTHSKSVCQRHGNKQLEAYCVTHKEVICWECVGRHHMAPKCKCISAEEAIQSVQADITTLRQRLRTQIGTAEKLSRSDKDFTDGKRAAMQAIQSLEEKLNDFWRNAQAEIKLLKFEVEATYSSCLQERKTFYGLAASLLDIECHFECLCENNDPAEILMALSPTVAQTDENDKVLKSLLEEKRSANIVFKANKHVEHFIANYGTIGSVDIQSGADDRQESALGPVTPLRPILERNRSNLPESRPKMHQGELSKTCVRRKTEFSARFKDAETSYVSGIAVWDNFIFVAVVDTEGATLKKFDVSGFLVDDVALNGTPHALVAMKPRGILAITQPDKHVVCFMHALEKLDAERYITTKKSYNGLCQLDSMTLVMSSWSTVCVDIVDILGQVYRTLEFEPGSERPLFKLPDMLCMTTTGNIVVSEAQHQQLTCIDQKTGRVLWTHRTPAHIHGICSDGDGDILICLKDNGFVQRIKDDGTVEADKERFITEADGISEPRLVTCRNDCLVVVATKTGQIHMYNRI